jgi:FixJ family two-component response regulator
MPFEPTVYIVDDDPGILKSMRWLLESAHLRVKTFNSGALFLECYDADDPGCLILDMRMPGMTGLDVQKRLAQMGAQLPIIIMTAHADVPVCIESFKSGVFDFIEKPANDDLLLGRVRKALALDAENRRRKAYRNDFSERAASLSARERQVMHLVVAGKNLKQIALELCIGVQTAAKHRAGMLEKLGLDNDVQLVRLAGQFDLASATKPAPLANCASLPECGQPGSQIA